MGGRPRRDIGHKGLLVVDSGARALLAHLSPYCRGATSITGFWTPKAVMKMLTTTMMKTRPVARLLRKSSLACLAGLLRSYLTVGTRGQTLHRGPAPLGPAAGFGVRSVPVGSAWQPCFLLPPRTKLRAARPWRRAGPAQRPGLDHKAHRAECTQGSPVLSARVQCLAIFTPTQGPVLTPTLYVGELRPGGSSACPKLHSQQWRRALTLTLGAGPPSSPWRPLGGYLFLYPQLGWVGGQRHGGASVGLRGEPHPD